MKAGKLKKILGYAIPFECIQFVYLSRLVFSLNFRANLNLYVVILEMLTLI